MLIKKKKLFFKVILLTLFSFFSIFAPFALSSCNKKSQDDFNDYTKDTKSFFVDVINNTSYYFSFNKNNTFSPFNLKNNYSFTWKYQENDAKEFQKQQKIFLKINCLKEFYLKKIGTIFCLPLITKINATTTPLSSNIETKDWQKELFNFPILDNDKNGDKNDKDKKKEIIIEFTKKQLEDVNKITDFDVNQNEYEIVFIVSFFSKSLSFKNADDLKKNNVGAKNVNIFLHLKLEKNNN